MITSNYMTYSGLHMWVYRQLGKASHCSIDRTHTGKRFEWSNISGLYKKDTSDFRSLCVSCHRKIDFKEDTRQKLHFSNRGKAKNQRQVSQYTKDLIFIKKYPSIKVASEQTVILRTSIANVLAGRAKTAGKYIWI